MDKSPKDQLANRIKESNNVLVTVSANPSVDQLSAAIGFTLFLSKLKKHATAVFSGEVPSTIEFLKPQETIEGNTDSLQDFIIALDKAKADKIRYKVEDQMVKIFITPYRSSIDQEDLQFSKGDFNVDVVVAVGVHNKDDLDQAITAHGRILHDATVATVNLKEGSELGAINWTDPQASSLCEMVVVLADMVKPNSFDAQMSTALLTGIVAETERFSNEKTSSNTMNASAKLMAAGANQQLVATKLEEPAPPPPPPEEEKKGKAEPAPEEGEAEEGSDGTLRIAHEEGEAAKTAKKKPEEPPPKEPEPEPEKPIEQIEISQEGELEKKESPTPPKPPAPPEPTLPHEPPPPQIKPEGRKFLEEPPTSQHHEDTVVGGPAGQSMPSTSAGAHIVTEPPSMGGKLSAMSENFGADDSDETPLSLPPAEPPILSHDSGKTAKKSKPKAPEPAPKAASSAQPPPRRPTPEPSNLAKAAEPPKPPTPPPAPPSPPPPPPQPPAPHSKLPASFISTLDDRTLKELERKTGSPHRTEAAANLEDETLQQIEKTVHSSHQVPPSSPAMDYEPHESEPPEKTSAAKTPSPSTPPPPPQPPKPPVLPKPKTPSAPTPSPDEVAARDAVMHAINTGGDGRSSLPALEGIGATDAGLDLNHPSTPPLPSAPPRPIATTHGGPPSSQQSSPNIEKIDEEGKVTFGPTNPPPLPKDDTAASVDDATAPPPVPPPMMPPPEQP